MLLIMNPYWGLFTQGWKNSGISNNYKIFALCNTLVLCTEAITINASEWLKSFQVPKKAIYIRVIMLELSHIAFHLLWLGLFMANSTNPLFFIFSEKENCYMIYLKLLRVYEWWTIISVLEELLVIYLMDDK